LLRRTRDDADRRVVWLELTAEGQEALSRAVFGIAELDRVLSAATTTELETITAGLHALDAVIRRQARRQT
jgi:DNA-binding MarR family transcriptional regulator